jgi:hypothetical protein
MDPFAALSAAAAIAQFVQMGATLVSKAYEAYSSTSGMPNEDEQLEFVMKEFSKVSESVNFKKPVNHQTDAEKSLAVVAEKCEQLSNKILNILKRTKADDPSSKRQSAVAALKSMWNDREKKELKREADDCRNLLHLQLTSVMGFVEAVSPYDRLLLTCTFAAGQRQSSDWKTLPRQAGRARRT